MVAGIFGLSSCGSARWMVRPLVVFAVECVFMSMCACGSNQPFICVHTLSSRDCVLPLFPPFVLCVLDMYVTCLSGCNTNLVCGCVRVRVHFKVMTQDPKPFKCSARLINMAPSWSTHQPRVAVQPFQSAPNLHHLM